MKKFDALIKGGTVVDGTMKARFVGDVGVKNGVVAQIGHDLAMDRTWEQHRRLLEA